MSREGKCDTTQHLGPQLHFGLFEDLGPASGNQGERYRCTVHTDSPLSWSSNPLDKLRNQQDQSETRLCRGPIVGDLGGDGQDEEWDVREGERERERRGVWDRQSLRKQRQTERTSSSDTGTCEVLAENNVEQPLNLFFPSRTVP
jgi:hypothetical protein